MPPPRKPAPVKGPIFIVSAMGTGSTLLRLILDSHPNIAIPHETGFMRIYGAMRHIPFKLTGRNWAGRLGWTEEEIDEEARQFFEKIFRRYADEHGKPRWGEKTPQHLWHVWQFKKLFPDCVIVGIVRHPGAAAASNMRRFGHTSRWTAYHLHRSYRELMRQNIVSPKRMVTIRYEDLVADTEGVMRELLEWLGEPWDDAVLTHHAVQAARTHDRIEGLTRPDQPVDADRATRWTTELPEHELRYLNRRLRYLARLWGYSFTDPAELEQITQDGSYLFRGADAKIRAELYPDMKVMERPDVPAPERLYHPRELLLMPNPYEGGRFNPGQKDLLEKPPPTVPKLWAGKALNALPGPVRRPLRRRRYQDPLELARAKQQGRDDGG